MINKILYIVRIIEKFILLICVNLLLYSCSNISNYPSFQYNINTMESRVVIYNIPTSFDYDNEVIWDQLGRFIVSTNYNNIILLWYGYGGYVEEMENFEDYLLKAKQEGKHIRFEIVGETWSSHALATCIGDVHLEEGNPQSALYFHPIDNGIVNGFRHYEFLPQQLNHSSVKYCINNNRISYSEYINLYEKHETLMIAAPSFRIYEPDL